MIESLTASLNEECLRLFGDPVHVMYNSAGTDSEGNLMHDWTIYTRLFGRRARFDVELNDRIIDRSYAVHMLTSQLAFQIMDQHEEDMLRGYTAYFDMDRKHTTGIVRHSGPYKIERWARPPREDHSNNIDFRIGPYKS